jgi:hypothetical protein
MQLPGSGQKEPDRTIGVQSLNALNARLQPRQPAVSTGGQTLSPEILSLPLTKAELKLRAG